MTLQVLVHGAAGRMGRAVIAAVARDPGLVLVGALEHAGHEMLGQDAGLISGGRPLGVKLVSDPSYALGRADVAIDFSSPSAACDLLARCREHRVPVVTGTTGFAAEVEAELAALSQVVPVVAAANMSPGVTVLLELVRQAAMRLGPSYDVEIVETHHRHKVDAPSGTAARLAEAVVRARGLSAEQALVYGRQGASGPRKQEEVGVHAVRAGDVVGDHTVLLAGEGERLELTHRAHSRGIFAEGAVRAARWVVSQSPGRYDMADVLGITRS